jgi:hypothetical protein
MKFSDPWGDGYDAWKVSGKIVVCVGAKSSGASVRTDNIKTANAHRSRRRREGTVLSPLVGQFSERSFLQRSKPFLARRVGYAMVGLRLYRSSRRFDLIEGSDHPLWPTSAYWGLAAHLSHWCRHEIDLAANVRNLWSLCENTIG